MMFYVVPNYLADALNKRLDEEIEKHPDAAPGREQFYSELLDYVNEHGVIPDFSLAKNQ